MELRDSKDKVIQAYSEKLTENDKLHVTWEDGKILIKLGENAEYGKSYKIRLKANDYSSVSTIKVSIPSKSKSNVTASVKAKGSIDVIRQGSAVTLTPSYKNCTAGKNWQETIEIYSSGDKYKNPILVYDAQQNSYDRADPLFHVERTEDGKYILTQAGAIDPELKYKVRLVSSLVEHAAQSEKTSISVKMGSAKVSMETSGTTLFARDKNDRAELVFTSTDETLNRVERISLKESKYRKVFEIIEYGNGEFAIGFKDGKVDSSLMGKSSSKSITLNLKVYLEGNDTDTANATMKLKLKVLK